MQLFQLDFRLHRLFFPEEAWLIGSHRVIALAQIEQFGIPATAYRLSPLPLK